MKKVLFPMLVLGLILSSGCNNKATNVPPMMENNPVTEPADGSASTVSAADALFEKSNLSETVTSEVETPPENLVLETIYFDFDKDALSSVARSMLAKHAQILRQYPQVRVLIEGHCDERGTIEYNLALGDRRAYTVKKYLMNSGIDAARLSTISYGKERPVVRQNTAEAWSKNRRGEFMIIK